MLLIKKWLILIALLLVPTSVLAATATADFALTVAPSSAQTPISIAPTTASIANTAAVGSVLTALTVGTSNGQSFAGTCALPTNPGNLFVMSGCQINVSASLSSSPGVTLGVSATESGTTINQNIVVTITSGGTGGVACSPPLSPATVGPVPAGYNCDAKYSDEFNGTGVDHAKWTSTGLPGGNDGTTSLFSAANCVVSGGFLQLISTDNGNGTYNNCAIYSSNNLIPGNTPFFIEVREKFDTSTQLWFFGDTANNPYMEIDWTSYDVGCSSGFGHCAVDALFFCWNHTTGSVGVGGCGGSQSNQTVNTPLDLTAAYHTYAIWRKADGGGTIQYYFDGALMATITGATGQYISQSAMVLFSGGQEHGGNPCPCPSTYSVDYIRVYHP